MNGSESAAGSVAWMVEDYNVIAIDQNLNFRLQISNFRKHSTAAALSVHMVHKLMTHRRRSGVDTAGTFSQMSNSKYLIRLLFARLRVPRSYIHAQQREYPQEHVKPSRALRHTIHAETSPEQSLEFSWNDEKCFVITENSWIR